MNPLILVLVLLVVAAVVAWPLGQTRSLVRLNDDIQAPAEGPLYKARSKAAPLKGMAASVENFNWPPTDAELAQFQRVRPENHDRGHERRRSQGRPGTKALAARPTPTTVEETSAFLMDFEDELSFLVLRARDERGRSSFDGRTTHADAATPQRQRFRDRAPVRLIPLADEPATF